MYTRTFAALAALALTAGTLLVSTPIQAAPLEDQVAVKVQTGDLDLSTARGAARLERRLKAAARQVCGWVPAVDLNLQRKFSACQEDAIAAVRGEVELALAGARPEQGIAHRSR